MMDWDRVKRSVRSLRSWTSRHLADRKPGRTCRPAVRREIHTSGGGFTTTTELRTSLTSLARSPC
jgi:hypothetical protein